QFAGPLLIRGPARQPLVEQLEFRRGQGIFAHVVAQVMLSRPFAQCVLVIPIGRGSGRLEIVDHEQGIPLSIRAVLCWRRAGTPSSREPREPRASTKYACSIEGVRLRRRALGAGPGVAPACSGGEAGICLRPCGSRSLTQGSFRLPALVKFVI